MIFLPFTHDICKAYPADWLTNAQKRLSDDGWVSPDTYSSWFRPIAAIPAVYLFLLHDRQDYLPALVAYVGMSTNLKQRLNGHPILAEVNRPDFWPMRWFKPTKKADLREVESAYIHRFDPPWNIIGRQRGLL